MTTKITTIGSLDSSVGIATRLLAGRLRNRGSFLERYIRYLSLGPTIYYLPPLSAGVKNNGAMTQHPVCPHGLLRNQLSPMITLPLLLFAPAIGTGTAATTTTTVIRKR
jgi:hypothetical protein